MKATEATVHGLLNAMANATSFAFSSTLTLSLHTADPSLSGTNEVTGGAYVRQAMSFGNAAFRRAATDAVINFTGMPSCQISHWGLWDNGTYRLGGALQSTQVIGAGDTVQVPLSNIALRIREGE